jgi:hypothetical protein
MRIIEIKNGTINKNVIMESENISKGPRSPDEDEIEDGLLLIKETSGKPGTKELVENR